MASVNFGTGSKIKYLKGRQISIRLGLCDSCSFMEHFFYNCP